MLAGVLTFVPVMTMAIVVKIGRTLGKGFGLVGKGYGKPGEIGGEVGSKGLEGWGLDELKGFGGSKGGPFEGLLKIMQMLV